MANLSTQYRKIEAARRRHEREASKRQRELEKRIKEQERLSTLESARLEVDAYENALEILLSIHKERNAAVDWNALAASLPPRKPVRSRKQEAIAELKNTMPWNRSEADSATAMEQARAKDSEEYEAAKLAYEEELPAWKKLQSLAQRVLTGEPSAYAEAVNEFSGAAEFAELGSTLRITVHTPRTVECHLKVKGKDIIPEEVKSLTASGKVSSKAMPKQRFHEIYQDYVCGCVLRLAREVFGILPIDTVLINASVDGIDSRTGRTTNLTVLSVAFPRGSLEQLNFDLLDPSDSVETFLHRGDAKASRKSGDFVSVHPLAIDELETPQRKIIGMESLLEKAEALRTNIHEQLRSFTTETGETPSSPDPTE